MYEVLERKARKTAHPHKSDADKPDEEIIEGLMEITALSLSGTLEDEPAADLFLKNSAV
jgi:hypothetical protein